MCQCCVYSWFNLPQSIYDVLRGKLKSILTFLADLVLLAVLTDCNNTHPSSVQRSSNTDIRKKLTIDLCDTKCQLFIC